MLLLGVRGFNQLGLTCLYITEATLALALSFICVTVHLWNLIELNHVDIEEMHILFVKVKLLISQSLSVDHSK